ncbi:MAG: gluconate 2-dehydrogenase subunit 3 family protein [Gammaproteobacteria bacterium]
MNNQADFRKTALSRRQFIRRTALLGSLALSYPSAALAELRLSKDKQLTANWLHNPAWQTLVAVQEVLFPAGENIPGAADIAATVYLHTAIENPNADGEDKDFIFKGIGWLDGLTQEQHKKTFVQLSVEQQEKIIQLIVKSRAGRNWVSMLLTYTLEALLADPVYAGNKNQAGWKWLQHQPGYPAPSVDKTWDQLQLRRYKA